VYDITVDDVHEFYACNIRVHNCLAVVYGAEAGRIASLMGVDYAEAESIIQAYLDTYPELKRYMDSCDSSAKRHGMAKTQFGRVRHLPIAKQLHQRYGERLLDRRWAKQNDMGDTRYKLKNALNNAKNFPIQGLAAHIVNRAMLATVREFRKRSLQAYIAMSVHDELCCIVNDKDAEEAAKVLKYCMENTTLLSVPLSTEPLIADNWADAK
jgi:DNA polymerase-1